MERSILIHVPAENRELEGLALRPVLGIPLFLRTILSFFESGVKQFTILCSADMRLPIQKYWSKYISLHGAKLQIVTIGEHNQLEPEELNKLQSSLAAEYYLFDALTTITNSLAQDLQKIKTLFNKGILPGHLGLSSNIAKELPALLLANSNLQAAREERSYCRIIDKAGISNLENFLCENIRLSANGWVAMNLNKRISLPISRTLSRLRISPNSITIFNMLVGLLAGIATAGLSYVSLLCGGILFQAASVLDGCDGEVAKLTHRSSKFGQLIDTVSDNFSLSAFFVGLTIHHIRISNNASPLLLALFLFAGIGTLITVMMSYQRKYSDSLSLVTFDRIFLQQAEKRNSFAGIITRYGKMLLKKEWFSIIFMFMAIIGILPYTMHLVALATWVGVFTIWQLQKETRNDKSSLLDLKVQKNATSN